MTTVWTEREATGWKDCVWSSYLMAMEYGGYSKFPLGTNTDAERNAFAGSFTNGARPDQADANAQARYGVSLKPLDTSLAAALKRPGYALVVTGNYANIGDNSQLAADILQWNNYPGLLSGHDVNHAVTVITNQDGTLTWLDPTAPNNSNGVTVSAADVLKFNGGDLNEYPVRMVKQGELATGAPTNELTTLLSGLKLDSLVGQKWTDHEDILRLLVSLGYISANTADNMRNTTFSSDNKALDTPGQGTIEQYDVDYLKAVISGDVKTNDPNSFNATTEQVVDALVKSTEAVNPLGIGDLVGILSKLTNASNWLHLGVMLAGVALIGVGIYLTANDVSGGAISDKGSDAGEKLPMILAAGA